VLPIRKGIIKRIHVNQFDIRKGEPTPLRVKVSGFNYVCHQIEIRGPSTVVYRPDKPMSCGAKVWIETTAEVLVLPLEREKCTSKSE
jgi:hypothetical protein